MKNRNDKIRHEKSRYGIKLTDIATHCHRVYALRSESAVEDGGTYEFNTDFAYHVYLNNSSNETVLLIAFRGTVADNEIQWIQNLTTPFGVLVNLLKSEKFDHSALGYVGWKLNSDKLIDNVLSKNRLDVRRPKIICCGHSRGGYLALLGADYLYSRLKTAYPDWSPNISVVGFGMPIFEPLTENMLHLNTITCYIHLNDLVGKTFHFIDNFC